MQAGEELRARPLPHPAAVFAKRFIANVEDAVLDGPMPPIEVQELLGIGLIARQTGDAVDHFARPLCVTGEAIALSDISGDAKDLSNTRPAELLGEVEIQSGGALQRAAFFATVLFADGRGSLPLRFTLPLLVGGKTRPLPP